jgi:outer membrane protein OmpA-like peptidoglycan-associated protein
MRSFLQNISLLLLLFLLLIPDVLVAQRGELSTRNLRAKRAFEDAVAKYNHRDVKGAEESFKDAIRFDPGFIEAYIVMGEMYQNASRHHDAIAAFQKGIEINPDFFPNAMFYLSECHYAIGEYEQARKTVDKFLGMNGVSANMKQRGTDHRKRLEFALQAIKNPVPFEPKNLGSGVNSRFDEYAPVLTADEQTLIFTRKIPRQDMNFIHLGPEYEDFFVSYRDQNGEWGPAFNMGPPINTQNNEGAQSISADGMHLYFTACGRPGGMGSCDIYYSRRIGEGWSQPVNLGAPVNSSSWDSQPSISADGKTLFFVSNRRGNTGRMDIWFTTRTPEGRWAEPQNLGPQINTSGREMSPFIHPDNKTLFFASDTHPGMGGMDLFYTIRDENGNWQKPVNLGYPINTAADEISLVVGASGREAYFASEQTGGVGGTDLYYFELYPEARPTAVTYMKGIVFDSDTRQKLDATFELIDLTKGEIILQSTSNAQTGEFLVPIPVGANLALNAWKNGYLFFSEHFAFEDVRTGVDPHLYDIPMSPIRMGETVVLKNIFFRTDSHELLPQSMSELQKLLDLLNQNPALKIEISGHTDNTGSFTYNKTLSERRALSVFNYLIEKGINRSRLSYKGYADQQPIATNDTEEGRAQNRRTEFKVTGNTNL